MVYIGRYHDILAEFGGIVFIGNPHLFIPFKYILYIHVIIHTILNIKYLASITYYCLRSTCIPNYLAFVLEKIY